MNRRLEPPGFLLVNPRSGSADANLDDLLEACAAAGVETRVLDEGDDPAAIAARADTAALGMAGGDARLRALGFALRPPEPLALRVNGESLSAAILLVANNEYRLDALFIGERERLDEGVLALYVTSGSCPGAGRLEPK